MTFEEITDIQRAKHLHNWSHEKRELVRIGYNAAIEECTKIAESEKEKAKVMGMDEYFSACEYIVKEITSREA